MAKFDLHLHSNNSDGSSAVNELIHSVIKANIEIFALTDHDTIAGISEVETELNKTDVNNICFIKGVELTCKVEDIKCHILGYNINPDCKELSNLIALGKQLRKEKLETRIKYLKDAWNIELTQEESDWLYSRKSVVKTHLANILVNRKLANNNIDAMKKYLDGCKTGNTRFDGDIAIQAIIKSGGIPVWAHPLGGEGEEHLSEIDFLPKLKTMIKHGIKGLECYYSRYSMQEIELLKEYAIKNNLLISGGSDWHGTNKTVELGKLNTKNIPIDSTQITLLKSLIIPNSMQ